MPSRPTLPAPCTALHCVSHCCHLYLLPWTVGTLITAFLYLFNSLYLFSCYVRCFLSWVFCALLLFCVLFHLCIQLSLSQFCINLPTTANWWKPNCSQKISYHITTSRSQFNALHFFTITPSDILHIFPSYCYNNKQQKQCT